MLIDLAVRVLDRANPNFADYERAGDCICYEPSPFPWDQYPLVVNDPQFKIITVDVPESTALALCNADPKEGGNNWRKYRLDFSKASPALNTFLTTDDRDPAVLDAIRSTIVAARDDPANADVPADQLALSSQAITTLTNANIGLKGQLTPPTIATISVAADSITTQATIDDITAMTVLR